MPLLCELKPGEKALVTQITALGRAKEAFDDLGLTPGTLVEAALVSPGGDPAAYFFRGGLTAFRRKDAKKVLVEKL